MKKGTIIGIVIIVVALILFFTINDNSVVDSGDSVDNADQIDGSALDSNTDRVDDGNTVLPSNGDVVDEPQTFEVAMSASGFSPGSLTISAGDTVRFVAEDSTGRWPATAVHPSHTVYPGSSRSKCGSSDADEIFDACGIISSGDSYDFIFTEVGSWNYHDHIQPGKFGTIIVE